MSTAQLVVQHLPYLRRYARALTGSQMAGDAYVAATLETLVSEPETIGQGRTSRSSSVQVFTRIWNSLSVNGQSELIQRDLPAEVRLGQITPLPRQAFLLSCLEGFSEEESAAILAVDVAEGARSRRRGRARDRRRHGDRHPDHRGRAADRHGPRSHRRGPRPQRHRRRPHAHRSGEARRRATARAWSSPTSSSPTAAPGSTR